MIPAIAGAGRADAVDAFCESVGFTPAQTERVFKAAAAHGLSVKVHAEQLSNSHGAALAARYGALSADHLEHLDAAGIAAMATRSEEHTSELQSLMRISYAVFCLKKKKHETN